MPRSAVTRLLPVRHLLILCLLPLVAHATTGRPVFAQSISERAQEVARQLDELSAERDLSTEDDARAFLAIMEWGFDLDTMARAALGPDQQPEGARWQAYRSAYRAHMVQSHLAARRYGPTETEWLGLRTLPDGGSLIQLRVASGVRQVLMLWLPCGGEGPRICDVEMDGLRLSRRQRDTFSPVLDRLGWPEFLHRLQRGALVESG